MARLLKNWLVDVEERFGDLMYFIDDIKEAKTGIERTSTTDLPKGLRP